MTPDRLLSRVHVGANGCWVWTGPTSKGGYGRVHADGANRYVHRVSYELFTGAIPEGFEIDHLCRCRLCVNPAHLEAVTPEENARRTRGVPRYKSTLGPTCNNGHPRTPEHIGITRTGSRFCRTCKREQLAAWRSRQLVAS